MDYECGERWFSVRVSPLGELGGGAIVTHHDISQLKSAELHLRRDGMHLEAVFDEATSIFALVDEQGICRQVSEETGPSSAGTAVRGSAAAPSSASS